MVVIWKKWISNSLISNLGKVLERLSDLSFSDITIVPLDSTEPISNGRPVQ